MAPWVRAKARAASQEDITPELNDQNPFPSPALLGNSFANWSAEVMAGTAPRCPSVEAGSNPGSTVSVIEHTNNYVRLQFSDFGDCGASGRVAWALRLRYLRPPPPTITQQLQDVAQPPGTQARLSVAADGNALSYQWLHEGTNVVGGTDPRLVLASLRSQDGGTYQVLVSNEAGEVPSRTATVTGTQPIVRLRVRSPLPGVVALSWDSSVGITYRVLGGASLDTSSKFTPLAGPSKEQAGPSKPFSWRVSPRRSTSLKLITDRDGFRE